MVEDCVRKGFEASASSWMRGAEEQRLFDFVIEHGLPQGDAEAVSAALQDFVHVPDHVELAQAIHSFELTRVVQLQLTRIVRWFQSTPHPTQCAHINCYRSMLRKLCEPWDVAGFAFLTRTIRDANLSWQGLDADVLLIADAIMEHASTPQSDESLKSVLYVIGDTLGPR